MTKKISNRNHDPEHIFQQLEKVAEKFPLRAFRITDDDHNPTGLYFKYDPEKAGDSNSTPHIPTPATLPISSESATEFTSLLTIELDRAAHSHLPCSLILLHIPDSAQLPDISAICWPCLEQFDLLKPFTNKIIAIILPAANPSAALKRTRAIMAAIKKAVSPGPDIRAGIATCHTANALTPAAFIEIAEQELNNAMTGSPGAIHNVSLANPEDGCQVTVEERTQLFSIFKANDADDNEDE